MTQQERDEYKKRKVLYQDRFRQLGLDDMNDLEVIEFVLMFSLTKHDAKIVANKLFDRFNSYVGILEADIEDLCEVEGMSEQASCLINMIMPIHAVYHNSLEEKMNKKLKLENTKAIFKYLKPKFLDTSNERIIAVFLDDKYTLIESRIMGEGAFNSVDFNKTKILITAIRLKSSKIIIAHNHPHGDNKASFQDDMMTKDLINTLNPMGIDLIDHMIISDNNYYSYNEDEII